MNPKTGIDVDGGDTLTIDGRGFGTSIADIEVKLDNIGETECVTQTLTPV